MFGKIKTLGNSESQVEFRKQEQIARLERVINKVLDIFGQEKITVPEGIDIVCNLLSHTNKDIIRILNSKNDTQQPTTNKE